MSSKGTTPHLARTAFSDRRRLRGPPQAGQRVVEPGQLGDHVAVQDPATVATLLGLPVGADAVQVVAAAALAREKALRQLVVLTGAETYLTEAVHQPANDDLH
ncbi:hypothetical protein HNR25_000021 [Streptomonospora salina]|uniref:Uncharacterized protein n=1 Tax=Streptomonospora salina TaxID=104205 RepID=A0A841E6U2_9ACTN|nr:hypothetical protein [Streptomonospora salina]MBB5996270.1 hypothetical protein [Streptomonospora salina]